MRLRQFLWPVPIETEIDEEIAEHIELQTKRFVDGGLPEHDAREAALRRFGNRDRVRDECRAERTQLETDMRRTERLHDLRTDVVYALRTLRKSPAFTLIALATIAIGVGANTAIFSVVDAVLLRGLPYRNADRTIVMWNSYGAGGLSHAAVAADEYFDYMSQLRSVDAIGALRPQSSAIIGDGGEPEFLNSYAVTPTLFDLLGATPLIGRGFHPEEGKAGGEKVIILSHALWMRRFGGDRGVLGRTVNVAGQMRTIIGVMPADVRFPDAPLEFLRDRADIWIPSTLEQFRGSRGNQIFAVIARTRAGSTLATVRADVDALQSRFRAEYPDRYAPPAVPHWSIELIPLRDALVGAVRPALLVLAGAVGLVMLIACVNVANLLLARGALRHREMAVRLALGAGRGRLVRQLLTESMLLALAGGALGIALAQIGVRALIRLDAGNIPRLDGTRIDGVVLAFAIGISLITGIVAGLAPALQQSRAALTGALGEGARGSSEGRGRRLRAVLVTAQVAMALVILVAAGLLGRSFAAMQRVSPGFNAQGVMSMQLSLPRVKYDSGFKMTAFFDRAQLALAAMPGASEASAVYPLPMSEDGWGGSLDVEGEPSGPGHPQAHAEYAVALPGYFHVMRIPLASGRDFAAADNANAQQVAIVDEMFAKQHWPNASAVGKRVNPNGPQGVWVTIVGVVGHVRNSGPQSEGEGQIYLPHAQNVQRQMSVVVRANVDPASLSAPMRQAVRALDPDLPVAKLRTAESLVAGALSRQRFNMMMLGVFAAVALGLATVGLYGVMSYLVSQRAREIGIRMALGGQPSDVRTMVVRESLAIAVSGLVVGVIASLALSRVIAGLLFGVTVTDGLTYSSISALLLIVAVLAAYGPARRATRIDPIVALRD